LKFRIVFGAILMLEVLVFIGLFSKKILVLQLHETARYSVLKPGSTLQIVSVVDISVPSVANNIGTRGGKPVDMSSQAPLIQHPVQRLIALVAPATLASASPESHTSSSVPGRHPGNIFSCS
jgi:hypothetical protein